LLAAGAFVSGLTMRIAEPLLPKVASDFDVGVGSAAVLITGFSLSYGLFQVVHGPLGDRVGKLRVVAAALVLAGAGSIACAAASSLPLLAVFRFLTGMGAGAIMPLALAYIGDTVAYGERQAALGRFLAGILLGQSFGPLVGGVFSDVIGWRAAFVVPAVAFVLLGVLLAPLARGERAPEREGADPLNPLPRFVALARSPAARPVLVAVGLEAFLFFGSFGYLGAFLRHEFALSYTAIGLIMAGFGLGGVAYSLLVRLLVARAGQRGIVGIGGALICASLLAVALAPRWAVCVPAIFVLGTSLYMFHNTLQTRATEMAPGARGLAVSLFAIFLFAGQTIGVTVFGPLVESVGYRPMIAVSAVGLAVLAAWFRHRLATLPTG
jgi:predicted MFS family arabinose efflux permease